MAKPDHIELGDGTCVPILWVDRSVLAIDKPAGWLIVPAGWRQTRRNLQAALESGLAAGAYWARAHNLKFLRFVHRLDAETSGVLLLARSRGALPALSALFESRGVAKRYLAVVQGLPGPAGWTCKLPLGPVASDPSCMRVDQRSGKAAETQFRRLAWRRDASGRELALVEAWPLTGRTHQIRVHLAATGFPVLGDSLYGGAPPVTPPGDRREAGSMLALRAVEVSYTDPFTRKRVRIEAPSDDFLATYGFSRVDPNASASALAGEPES
jgi:RluA family pseudouridine synthase